MFYLNCFGQLESRVGRRTPPTRTPSRTSYGTTKRSHLWTTLTSPVCQHRCRCSRPTSTPRFAQGGPEYDLAPVSHRCRCSRPTPSSRSHHWRDAYDVAPLSRRRVYRGRTAIARYATLSLSLVTASKRKVGCMPKIAIGSKFKMAAAAILNFVFGP